jgi:hypothetical protein
MDLMENICRNVDLQDFIFQKDTKELKELVELIGTDNINILRGYYTGVYDVLRSSAVDFTSLYKKIKYTISSDYLLIATDLSVNHKIYFEIAKLHIIDREYNPLY